jgi:hypothetical protein
MGLAEGREILVLGSDDPTGQVAIGGIPPEAHAEAVHAQHLHVDAPLIEGADTVRSQRFLLDGDLVGKPCAPDDVHDRRDEIAVGVDVHYPYAPASHGYLTSY